MKASFLDGKISCFFVVEKTFYTDDRGTADTVGRWLHSTAEILGSDRVMGNFSASFINRYKRQKLRKRGRKIPPK